MKDVLITTMGGQKIAIFTKHIISLIEKPDNGGTEIHVYDMVNPYYTTQSITEILISIDANY